MMSTWKEELGYLKEEGDFSSVAVLKEQDLKEGSLVYLKPRSPEDDPEPALIRYCGPIPELGAGKFYGIEILVPSSQGICDGSVLDKRYFLCRPGCGNFVRSTRLMPYRRTSKSLESTTENGRTFNGSSPNGPTTTTLVLHLKKSSLSENRIKDEASSDLIDMGSSVDSSSPNIPLRTIISPPHSPPCPFSPPIETIHPIEPPKSPPLKLGDRVVWLSDLGPEHGTVRWLGVLPGSNVSPHTMAGVEFDNPVGTGTGLYNRHQLFTARKKHASFIPLLGLIRAEDFNSPEKKPKSKPKSFDQPLVLLADEKYKSLKENIKIKSPKGDFVDCNGFSTKINNLTLSPNNPNGTANHLPVFLMDQDYWAPPMSPQAQYVPSGYHHPNSPYPYSYIPDFDELRSPVLPLSPVSDPDGYYSNPPIHTESPTKQKHTTTTAELGVGSVVEVMVNNVPRYGVIRWVGYVPDDHQRRKVAGIEMEEDLVGGTDGTFNGRRFFRCASRRGFFVGLSQCRKDGRFQESLPANNVAGPSDRRESTLTQPDCPVIPGYIRPLGTPEDVQAVCGKFRGIQGHHNSCYLDATLFGMFAFTSVFDSLLFRPGTSEDGPHYEEVQRVLREEIVNPLRNSMFVRADRVMRLRTLLEKIGSVSGMTSEEKDPEELLTSLVAQTLRAEPFLKLSSGQEAFMHQLFVEKDEQLELPSVQQLFEQSFLSSDIKLKEVPPCLIIQMPRFGKAYKMYPRILPSQVLDITDVIENCPRQCIVCGKLALFECRECFGQCGAGLESIAFCEPCLETAHSHQRRQSHAWRRLTVPREYLELLQELDSMHRQNGCREVASPPIPRIYMELFAVVCIETSHYVAFVKGGSGPDAPWVFFDSMADRRGEQNGYNIPEVSLCPELPHWLSEQGARGMPEVRDERQLPERAKRLLCDAYMCFYQSPDVAMYN